MSKDIKTLFSMFKQLDIILSSKQKKQIVGILFLIIVGSFVEMLGVSAVLPFIESLLTPEILSEKWYFAPITKITGAQSSFEIIVTCGILIVAVYLLKNLFLLVSTWRQSKFRCQFQKDLSTTMLRSYVRRPYTFFLNTNSAEVLRGIGQDVYGTFEIMRNMFLTLSETLTVAMIGIFIIYTDPFMACGILGLALICFFVITFSLKPILSRIGKELRAANFERGKCAYQSVMGIKEIKVTQREQTFIEGYDEAYEKEQKIEVVHEVANALPVKIIETVCIAGLIFVVCIKIKIGIDIADFVTKLGTFALAAFKILPSISRLTEYLNNLVYYRPALEAVYNNLDEVKKYEKELETYISVKDEQFADLEFTEELRCRNVIWKYQNAKDDVLKGLNMSIRKGEAVALIGASGAGKTTLADCILGLLKPESGMIEMDGIDIFSIPKQWSRIIGYVPQTVFLIDDSVRANIIFGAPKEEWDDDKVWKVLKQAQLDLFVHNLPDGLDTIVGERGVKFSGGQRQRIAIARALYYNPEILVLDEATSALDNETEKAVMESIEALQGHKTLIIVAHRLTTIRKCDKIYEIVDGHAVLREKKDVFQGNS